MNFDLQVYCNFVCTWSKTEVSESGLALQGGPQYRTRADQPVHHDSFTRGQAAARPLWNQLPRRPPLGYSHGGTHADSSWGARGFASSGLLRPEQPTSIADNGIDNRGMDEFDRCSQAHIFHSVDQLDHCCSHKHLSAFVCVTNFLCSVKQMQPFCRRSDLFYPQLLLHRIHIFLLDRMMARHTRHQRQAGQSTSGRGSDPSSSSTLEEHTRSFFNRSGQSKQPTAPPLAALRLMELGREPQHPLRRDVPLNRDVPAELRAQLELVRASMRETERSADQRPPRAEHSSSSLKPARLQTSLSGMLPETVIHLSLRRRVPIGTWKGSEGLFEMLYEPCRSSVPCNGH